MEIPTILFIITLTATLISWLTISTKLGRWSSKMEAATAMVEKQLSNVEQDVKDNTSRIYHHAGDSHIHIPTERINAIEANYSRLENTVLRLEHNAAENTEKIINKLTEFDKETNRRIDNLTQALKKES